LVAGDDEVVVTPPLGATTPRPLVVGVHGAGDRPEWSCGGWRLGTQVSAFVACPRGSKAGGERFAWASAQQLASRVETAISQTRARFGAYVAEGPMIYAGFSQGATLAEPLLLQHAARFPIAILAEGGYQTARSASFARAFRDKGGRRVVLVCGTPACFQHARAARKGLERAGLQVLVVGDEKAGHNLNERMQKALQNAWTEISAPLQPPEAAHADP
jgi:predicted esterase